MVAVLNHGDAVLVAGFGLEVEAEGAIDGERVRGRVVAVDIGAEKDEAGKLVLVGGRVGAGHRPAHRVAADEPRAYLGVGGDDTIRGVLVKNCQVERHLDENAGDAAPLADLLEDGQVGSGLDLGPGIEDERRGRTQAGRITW